ncbi:MAG TPA: HAD family phosphatase [Candidatus Saccharimonadales bacterium]|nr:HAD family phosphatase [Candidatus Saccharimonadales bacterium]
MYKVVIFDFFGVFCSPLATDWFKASVPDYEPKMQEFEALCTESDYGRLTRAALIDEFSKLSGVPPQKISDDIEAGVRINTALVDYANQLKTKGYRVACLSNGNHEWTQRVIDEQGLGHVFEQVIMSSDLGMVKPNRDIYERCLDMLGVNAGDAIFVDDRQVNVTGAEACGIRSLLFTDTPAFITEFESLQSAQ